MGLVEKKHSTTFSKSYFVHKVGFNEINNI